MLPLLLLVSGEEFAEVHRIFPLIVCASFVTAIGNLFSARALLYLPVGLATALTMTFSSIVALLIGVLFLGEGLTPTQIVVSILLLGTIVVLGASRSSSVTLESFDLRRGVEASLGFGLSLGTGFVLVAIASREVSPFLAGYLWEFLAGLFAAGFAVTRGLRRKNGLQRIESRELLKLALYSSPTAVGTGCFTYATIIGPISIVSAILPLMMVENTVLARWLYRERLTPLQWLLLIVAAALIALLKFVSGS